MKVGAAQSVQLKPVAGNQVYEAMAEFGYGPKTGVNKTLLPSKTVVSAGTIERVAGSGLMTVNDEVAEQLSLSVTVTKGVPAHKPVAIAVVELLLHTYV